MRIADLARAIAPDCHQNVVGIRPGEKIHEVLLSEDEARHTFELDDSYVVMPPWVEQAPSAARRVPEGFRYSSELNDESLTVDEIRRLLGAETEKPEEEED
jgi:UDP-N-acetylglucosamine 4,6-dehydratase